MSSALCPLATEGAAGGAAASFPEQPASASRAAALAPTRNFLMVYVILFCLWGSEGENADHSRNTQTELSRSRPPGGRSTRAMRRQVRTGGAMAGQVIVTGNNPLKAHMTAMHRC